MPQHSFILTQFLGYFINCVHTQAVANKSYQKIQDGRLVVENQLESSYFLLEYRPTVTVIICDMLVFNSLNIQVEVAFVVGVIIRGEASHLKMLTNDLSQLVVNLRQKIKHNKKITIGGRILTITTEVSPTWRVFDWQSLGTVLKI